MMQSECGLLSRTSYEQFLTALLEVVFIPRLEIAVTPEVVGPTT